MSVLSIVGCEILQDEIVWILENDSQIKRILIVKNENISEFTEKLNEQNICYDIVLFEELPQILKDEDENGLTVVVNILELGLHMHPKDLKSAVYQNIREILPFSNGILLFYGLCGNVLGDVEKDFSMEKDDCIVRILRDKDDRIVDDCIGATVGGCANYFKILKENSKEPAFFFTPMYANSWKKFKVSGIDYNTNPEEALKMDKMVNDMSGYSRVAKVTTGLTYVKNFDEKIEEHAELFGYSIFEIQGDQEIFEKCYFSIKDELNNIN